jgi:hypothetical protein
MYVYRFDVNSLANAESFLWMYIIFMQSQSRNAMRLRLYTKLMLNMDKC